MGRPGSRLGVEDLLEGARERRLGDATAEIGVREEDRLARAIHVELLLRNPDACTEHDALRGPADRDRLDVSGNPELPLKVAGSGRKELRGRLVDRCEIPRAQRTPPQPIQAMATSSP